SLPVLPRSLSHPPPTPLTYPLSLHDALPISRSAIVATSPGGARKPVFPSSTTSGMPPAALAMTGTAHAIASSAARPNDSEVVERSEEHTSELQSLRHLVCRLLLEKKKERMT